MSHRPTFVERLLNRILSHKVIVNCERDPYLLRWYLFKTERVSCFIHKFIRSDEDRALHDHPWSFLVIPVWRGYIEHSDRDGWKMLEDGYSAVPGRWEIKRRVWPLISSRFRPATYRHRVELIDSKPSWSIFFHFKRERDWGFHPAEGFTLWNKWWQDKCE